MKIYGYDLKEIINSDISILHTSKEESIIDQRIVNIIFGDKKKTRYITKHNTKHGKLIDVDIYVSIINIDNEDFGLYCIREFTEQQEVLRSYERGLDIMTKVVKELSM
jgi:PAS domain S-box-containing protein